jgi:hypothetical protein
MAEETRTEHKGSDTTSAVRVRQPYKKPSLTRYGRIASLVQGGSFTPSPDGQTGMMGMSDRRAKENVRQVDRHPLGFGLYVFDFKPEHRDAWGHGRQFGVMADEVEEYVPDAVSVGPGGFKLVDYAKLGISRRPC